MTSSAQTTRILVIESELELLQADCKLLSGAGFDVYRAASGEEGLAQAREVDPELILLSVRLPDTNGYLLTEIIKSDPELGSAYVLLISGEDTDSRDRAKGLELGAEGYLVRPITDRELLARVVSLERLKKKEKELRSARIDLERLDPQLHKAHQDLQEFAYAVSHDLQEPLRMITSFLDLLERRYEKDLDDTAREYIAFAVDGARRMKAMIEGVLTFSRVNTHGGEFEIFSSQQAFQRAVRQVEPQIEERGAVINAGSLPEVVGDPDQIARVFQHLISNAILYNEADVPRVDVQAEEQGREWQFAVKDNGIGIRPEHHDRVFTIFQREHTRDQYPGVGVGLSIARRIVERHGGEIWLESDLGGGSIFFFTLPGPKRSGRQENNPESDLTKEKV
jgi:signal transduction histidine kinase